MSMYSPISPQSSASYLQQSYFSPSSLHQSMMNSPPPGGHYFHQQTPSRAHVSPIRQQRLSRKSDDFEPMSTSPTFPPLYTPSPSTSFLPAFLTGEPHYASKQLSPRSCAEAHRVLSGVSFRTEPFETPKSKGCAAADGGEKEGAAVKTGPPTGGLCGSEPILKVLPDGSGGGSFTPSRASLGGSSPPSPEGTTDWVTVFGFPSSSASYVLTQFGQYGTILEYKTNPGSNWIHLKYSNRIEARRALHKNGCVISGTMMVGVIPCDEAMARDGRPPGLSFSQTSLNVGPSSSSLSSVPSRPLEASPAAARKENVPPIDPQVRSRIRALGLNSSVDNSFVEPVQLNVPEENNGIISSALEWLFGW